MTEKNLLITLWFADGLHGGVRYSAEIGKYFHSLGYNVYVCGVITNDVTKEYFEKNHVKLINVANFPTNIKFDIVWAHHWPILPFLIYRGLKYKRIVNSTISEFLFLERPIWFEKNIDLHVVLTDNLNNILIKHYNIKKNKICMLPNTAPDEYFEYKFQKNKDLKSIAVVSNHPVKEVIDALAILNEKGYNTILYGAGNSVDITPEILSKHDVIITIGKTVQYAMAMGIPVYNYDHFGGSGYITPDNIQKESEHNFSGRSFFIKKTSEQIVDEIINEYNQVMKYQSDLKKIAEKQYRLSVKINEILKILFSKPERKHIKINNKNRIFFDYCGTFIDLYATHNNQHIQVIDYKNVNIFKEHKKLYKIIKYSKHNQKIKLNIFGAQILKIKNTDKDYVVYLLGLQIFKRHISNNYAKINILGIRVFKYKI